MCKHDEDVSISEGFFGQSTVTAGLVRPSDEDLVSVKRGELNILLAGKGKETTEQLIQKIRLCLELGQEFGLRHLSVPEVMTADFREPKPKQ